MNIEQTEKVGKLKLSKERLLGRLLNRSYRLVKSLTADYLTALGYKYFRVGYIVALLQIEEEGSNINTMAQRAGISKQAMSKLVKELQTEKFVTIQKDKADARAIVVKITEGGAKFLLDWGSCIEHIDQKFADIVGLDQVEKLKDILIILANHYEQIETSTLKEYHMMDLMSSK